MSLIDWIKSNAREGADIAEAERLIQESNPLIGLDSIDDGLNLIKSNDTLKRAFDSMQSKAAASHDEKFNTEKLPNILKAEREKIRAELNPKETPEQKEIRELREWKESQIRESETVKMQDDLSSKAPDLGFDAILSRRFAPLGDGAEALIQDIVAWKDGLLGSELKGRYKSTPPKSGKPLNGLTSMTDSELYAAAKDHPEMKDSILEEVKRRTTPQ